MDICLLGREGHGERGLRDAEQCSDRASQSRVAYHDAFVVVVRRLARGKLDVADQQHLAVNIQL